MLNLLKIDFYKAFRSVSFWVITSLGILSAIIASCSIYNLYLAELKNPGQWAGFIDISKGFYQSPPLISDCILLTVILAIIFATSDFKHGTIKNIASKGIRREYIYLSKFITVVGAAIINIILSLLASFITAQIIIGNKIPDFFKFDNVLIKETSFILLQVIAYISIAIFLSMVFRSLVPPLPLMLPFITSERLIILSINNFIYNNLSSSFKINPYTIVYAFEDSSHILRGCIVILAYVVVSTVAGMFIFKKRDIN